MKSTSTRKQYQWDTLYKNAYKYVPKTASVATGMVIGPFGSSASKSSSKNSSNDELLVGVSFASSFPSTGAGVGSGAKKPSQKFVGTFGLIAFKHLLNPKGILSQSGKFDMFLFHLKSLSFENKGIYLYSQSSHNVSHNVRGIPLTL